MLEASVLRAFFTAVQSVCAQGETVIVDSVKFVAVHHVHEHRNWHNGNGMGSHAVHRIEVVSIVMMPRGKHNVHFQHLQAKNQAIERSAGGKRRDFF